MTALELAGALGRCSTLPQTLDLDMVRTVVVPDEPGRATMLAGQLMPEALPKP